MWLRQIPTLRRKYLSSTVNVLTKSPNISHITKRYIFEVNFPKSDKKFDKSVACQISQLFGPLWHFDCWRVFWNGFFRDLSNHIFCSRYFRKYIYIYITYEGHLFFIMFKNWARFHKCGKKLRKKWLVFDIILFALLPVKFLYYQEKTCHRQLMC